MDEVDITKSLEGVPVEGRYTDDPRFQDAIQTVHGALYGPDGKSGPWSVLRNRMRLDDIDGGFSALGLLLPNGRLSGGFEKGTVRVSVEKLCVVVEEFRRRVAVIFRGDPQTQDLLWKPFVEAAEVLRAELEANPRVLGYQRVRPHNVIGSGAGVEIGLSRITGTYTVRNYGDGKMIVFFEPSGRAGNREIVYYFLTDCTFHETNVPIRGGGNEPTRIFVREKDRDWFRTRCPVDEGREVSFKGVLRVTGFNYPPMGGRYTFYGDLEREDVDVLGEIDLEAQRPIPNGGEDYDDLNKKSRVACYKSSMEITRDDFVSGTVVCDASTGWWYFEPEIPRGVCAYMRPEHVVYHKPFLVPRRMRIKEPSGRTDNKNFKCRASIDLHMHEGAPYFSCNIV